MDDIINTRCPGRVTPRTRMECLVMGQYDSLVMCCHTGTAQGSPSDAMAPPAHRTFHMPGFFHACHRRVVSAPHAPMTDISGCRAAGEDLLSHYK